LKNDFPLKINGRSSVAISSTTAMTLASTASQFEDILHLFVYIGI